MNENAYKIVDQKLKELSKSTFRTSFKLKPKDIEYIKNNGLKKIQEHAYIFVKEKLRDISLDKDGSQTPTKNHPVFIAQHATACCCRGCLEKWHHIKKDKKLNNNEINYIVSIIMEWIKREYKDKLV